MDFAVDGMTCEHCVRAVTGAVGALPGVSDVTLDLVAGRVHVAGQTDPAAVKAAIEQEGYTVK